MSTSFQSYQSIFCLRLLKPLNSTTPFSSHKNCPGEISSFPILDGNLAFILPFPYDHRVWLVQRDHKGHLSAGLSAEQPAAQGESPGVSCSSPPLCWGPGTGSQVWSSAPLWHACSVCQANSYFILLPTADPLREFRLLLMSL